MKKTNGIVIYQGPSQIDGKPIAVIITGLNNNSNNSKTGAMLQSWILREDIEPHAAVKTGDDCSVCGDCPHRGTSCYVTVFQAPLSVWRAYKRGSYAVVGLDIMLADAIKLVNGRALRVGSYGDPAAIPAYRWLRYIDVAKSHTGYTHQWRKSFAKPFKHWLQASCDNTVDYRDAKLAGWSTFRIRKPGDTVRFKHEIACPADKGLACAQCGKCNGQGSKYDICIMVHGSKGKVNHFLRR